MSDIPSFDQVKQYYEERLTSHGATPRGVDWNSNTAQEERFSQLIKVIDARQPFSLLDYGAGYGALADYLIRLKYPLQHYTGFDALESMVNQAQEAHLGVPECSFTSNFEDLQPVDYAIASGTFNIKLETADDTWTGYVLSELHKMDALTRKGFSFNMLTSYSDADHMRSYLYYADPCFLFDYCKRHFSRNVALLHDYEIYDFTILVRKASA